MSNVHDFKIALPFTTSAAVSKGAAVLLSGSGGTISEATTGTDKPIGIAADDIDSGDVGLVYIFGLAVPALANGSGTAIEAGDDLMCSAGGVLVPATSTNVACATAVERTTANGQLIEVKFILPPNAQPTLA